MADLREKKPIKFSIGKFNTGIATIFGIVIKGILYGFITNTTMFNKKRFKFIKIKEFEYDKKYPNFRKKLGWWKMFVLKNKSTETVKYLTSFIEEVTNMPHYSMQYPEILPGDSRKVLIEKSSLSFKALNYSKLNAGFEWFFIQAIAYKYDEKFIKGVHLTKPVYTNDFWDLYRYNCVIQIPSFHNKELYITVHTYESMGRLYEIFAKHSIRDNGVEKELEEIREKNQ